MDPEGLQVCLVILDVLPRGDDSRDGQFLITPGHAHY